MMDDKAKYMRQWRAKNPRKKMHDNLQRRYGITLDQYEAMLQAQGGVCLLCGLPPAGQNLSVDHDHHTGTIRALLHAHCNLAIGHLEDSSVRAEQAAAYLRRFGR